MLILNVFECWFAVCMCHMVGSLWSACIWFVYVGFACAGVTNGWIIVAAGSKYGIDVYWFVLLMVFKCWFAVAWWLTRFGWLVFVLCMWPLHVMAWRTAAGCMIVAAACKYGIDVYWFVLLMVFILMVFECWFAECICVMMVGSLWSGRIWFVYVAFACAGATNDWMIVAAARKYGIDVYWFVSLMVFILMVFECWFAECIWHGGWFALVDMLKTTDIDT